MAGDKEQLLSMGFSEAKVTKALRVTKHAGLQPALDWLMEHAEEADPVLGEEAEDDDEAEAAEIKRLESQPGVEARSLVCDECGKKFRSQQAAECESPDSAQYLLINLYRCASGAVHAGKTEHSAFSESTEEIKPLTEEEKKEKLEQMRAAMAAKRAAKSKEDVEDARRNEQIRRKAGKESGAAQQELKLKQAEKEAEARKREKLADMQAKNKVKQQIEQDKKERAEKAAREKAYVCMSRL